MNETTTSIRTSFLIVSLLALAWLGLAIWVMFAEGAQPRTLFGAIQAFGLLLAPVAALFALASALGNREHLPTLRAADSLEESESQMAGIVTRIDTLRQGLAGELEALAAATAALEAQSKTARALVADISAASATASEASQRLEAALPDAARHAEALRQSLLATGSDAEAQARRTEAAALRLTDNLASLSAGGTQAAAALSEALERLKGRAGEGRAQSDAAIRSVRAEADTLFELIENTAVAKREAMMRQGEAAAGQLQETYARLEAMAAAASDQLATRLKGLAAQADAIEARLKSQETTTESLAASGERAFQLLDARLQHSGETSRTTLDRLSTRIQEVGAMLAQLTAPLKDTQGATVELEAAVKGLRETSMQTIDVLGETLPARTVEASRAAETLSAELMQLVGAIDSAHVKAAALAAPIAESRAALEAASEGYAQQRTAIEAAGQALVVELEQARQLISEVEEQTRDTSLSAASRLVDAMTRVREVATQTTGTMREMLDGVLQEARESLATAADEAMRKSFAEPIAEKAREAEAAAASAAERTASSMAALASTLKLLEDRSSDRLGAFEVAQQEDLRAAASLLTDRLATAAVSLGTALGRPMDDADWAQWRKGERSLFNRRALTLLDKREAKELRGLLQSDPEFRKAAIDYTAGFDALIRRFEGSAPGLAMALQGSDQGRLAAALSEALEG
jgi:hypothetical protein